MSRNPEYRDYGRMLEFLGRGSPDLMLTLDLLTEHESRLFVEHVHAHRLSGFLYRYLAEEGLAHRPEFGELEDRTSRRIAAHMVALGDTQELNRLLSQSRIPYLIMKGPILVETLYDDPALRPYGDVDLLVSPGDFEEAIRLMSDGGFSLIDANWRLLAKEGRSQLHLLGPLGTPIDAHWHLMNRMSVRSGFSVDIAGLLDRSRTVELPGAAVRTLSVEDQLLHLCIHASLSPDEILLRYVDIASSITVERPDWHLILERAHSWGAATSVGLALLKAKRFVGADVPEDALGHLLHGIQGWITRRVLQASSSALLMADSGFRSIWGELARDSLKETARVTGTRARRWMINRLRDRPDERVEAIRYADGGESWRDRYFAEIGS